MSGRPYLPTPRPALVDPGEPEPVELEVLRELRDLCANFRIPPRHFSRRVPDGAVGCYTVATDTVAVDPARADMGGLGGDDGYFATLLHELLHATGHPSRLERPSCGDLGNPLEEGTVLEAQRIVLLELGFDAEALAWHVGRHDFPVDWPAAREAAGYVFGQRL